MESYKSIQLLGWVVIALLALMIPLQPMWLAVAMVAPDFYNATIMPIANQIDGSAIGLRLFTMVVFGYWIYVAGRNLVAAGWEGLEFTPGSRIWWFAVPFANFIMPYFAMRELWNASHGADDIKRNNALLIGWWACWIGFALLSNFSRFAQPESDGQTFFLIAGVLLILPLHVLAIFLVHGITKAQRREATRELGDVFS